MRKRFIGYYPPTEPELKQIWETGIIVLDTNVLLNLYRYSKQARTALLDLIVSLKDRLWLPHQVGLEYHRHRLGQIYSERKNCDDLVSGFRKLLTNLDESRRHPFVSPEFRKKLDEMVKGLETEIKPTADELDEFRRKDPILERLTALYDGKVGPEPDTATKDAWLLEGEERYRRGIPPGFEDRKKADERRYGDLFVWKEILAFAGEKRLPVMFVTDDAKKDWWREQNGEMIGPNPALVSEMSSATGHPFHMYRPERFAEFAGKQTEKPLPKKVVEEVKNVRVADETEAVKLRESYFSALRELAKGRELPWSFDAARRALREEAMKLREFPALAEAARREVLEARALHDEATRAGGFRALAELARREAAEDRVLRALRDEAMKAREIPSFAEFARRREPLEARELRELAERVLRDHEQTTHPKPASPAAPTPPTKAADESGPQNPEETS